MAVVVEEELDEEGEVDGPVVGGGTVVEGETVGAGEHAATATVIARIVMRRFTPGSGYGSGSVCAQC